MTIIYVDKLPFRFKKSLCLFRPRINKTTFYIHYIIHFLYAELDPAVRLLLEALDSSSSSPFLSLAFSVLPNFRPLIRLPFPALFPSLSPLPIKFPLFLEIKQHSKIKKGNGFREHAVSLLSLTI